MPALRDTTSRDIKISSSHPTRRPVLLIFALTGASGLIYQVIWARQLGLVFGNTTTSISIVLSTFMAGLALGSWGAGKYLVASGNPLQRYAIFEGLIGLYAIVFGPLVKSLESLYPVLLADDASVPALTFARTIGALGLLIVPTTLMGATLPLTTEYLHRLKARHDDWNAGKLYAANTFGAAAGSFTSGFLLIELVGIQATTLLAAAFNLSVMFMGLRLASSLPERGVTGPSGAPVEGSGHQGYLWLFAATGALALAGEVVWTRALSLLLGNSTYAFSAMLVVYLTGIGAGSWVMSGAMRRFRDIRIVLPVSLLASATWYGIAVELAAPIHAMALPLRTIGEPSVSSAIPVLVYFTSVLALMLPGALLSGSLFPVVTRLIGGDTGDQGKSIARAYTWNTAGCIAGSLIGGFVIAPRFFQYHSIYVLSIAAGCLAVVAAVLVVHSGASRKIVPVIAAGAAAVTFWSLHWLGQDDLWLRRFHELYPGIATSFHRTGLQGVTTVAYTKGRKDEMSLIMVNGRGMTVKVLATKAMAHLPMILHGHADNTLVVCFGMGTTFRSALAHGGNVDVVELVPEVFDAFGEFHPDADQIRKNPRGRMIVNDGRNFLLLTRKKYDVITVDPPPPIDAAGVNNLYSRQFALLMRDHLAPGGIAAHWMPKNVKGSGIYDVGTADSLIATFADVFPFVHLISSRFGLHLLGTMQPMVMDRDRIKAVLANPEVMADLNEFSWEPFVEEAFFAGRPVTEAEKIAMKSLPLATDDRPYLEFNLLRNLTGGQWHRMFSVSP